MFAYSRTSRLSPNANVRVEHCISRANHYQLPVQVERVKVEKAHQVEVLEAKARDARYQAFERYLNPGDILSYRPPSR
ncbi:hypothetical protein PEC18_09910 [Paucibacter sp. O1-1]|nr:hypothetical protein [Paucibacter sp. O1-1]MDA3826162.1 hypothetical protein [Paucibacter sp. O1-1]